MIDLDRLLAITAKAEGSDLYLTAGVPPTAKVHGRLKRVSDGKLSADEVAAVAESILDEEQRARFHTEREMNLAYIVNGAGRFRINIFWQRNQISLVARYIKDDIPKVDDLRLPGVVPDLIMAQRGLMLVVGATGSGKSTTLAALVDHRNQHRDGHIITIEDPLEYVHHHGKSLVSQREVGTDTVSYSEALKNALRQAPDVIMIGEIRDRETMEHAIAYAETGHLCISTLHANSANQALDRIINFFPEERRDQLLLDLSLNLHAIISQRLIPDTNGGRALAAEVLIGSPLVRELIRRGDVLGLKEVMQKSENSGMQTFDAALFKLQQEERITSEEALRNADSQNDLRLRMKLARDKVAATASNLALEAPPKGHGVVGERV